MDKETYNSLPLTRWLDRSGKRIEDHHELPKERTEKTILKRIQGMPMETMLKSKIMRKTLKPKGYDLNQVETRRAEIGDDLRRLLEKIAYDKPVVEEKGKEEPEVTILRRNDADGSEDSLKEKKNDEKEVVQSLVERIPKTYLSGLWLGTRRWHSRRWLNTLDWVKSQWSGPLQKKMLKKDCPGSVKNEMKTQRRAAMTKIVYA